MYGVIVRCMSARSAVEYGDEDDGDNDDEREKQIDLLLPQLILQ